MRPADIQVIGNELAIKWSDATESFIALEMLRKACPCAGCKGEMDIMGNVYRGAAKPLTGASFELREIRPVGTYALEPIWGDGHNTGLFTFDLLRKLAEGGGGCGAASHEHEHDHEHGHRHDQHHHGHDHGQGGCGCGRNKAKG